MEDDRQTLFDRLEEYGDRGGDELAIGHPF